MRYLLLVPAVVAILAAVFLYLTAVLYRWRWCVVLLLFLAAATLQATAIVLASFI